MTSQCQLFLPKNVHPHYVLTLFFFFPTSIQLKDRLIQGDRQIMLPLFEVEVNDNMQLQYYQISINDL
jgi:hypothetical protein